MTAENGSRRVLDMYIKPYSCEYCNGRDLEFLIDNYYEYNYII